MIDDMLENLLLHRYKRQNFCLFFKKKIHVGKSEEYCVGILVVAIHDQKLICIFTLFSLVPLKKKKAFLSFKLANLLSSFPGMLA